MGASSSAANILALEATPAANFVMGSSNKLRRVPRSKNKGKDKSLNMFLKSTPEKGKMKTRSQASYLVKRENNKKLLVKKGYGSKRTYI